MRVDLRAEPIELALLVLDVGARKPGWCVGSECEMPRTTIPPATSGGSFRYECAAW
jgi:hypothetical protein